VTHCYLHAIIFYNVGHMWKVKNISTCYIYKQSNLPMRSLLKTNSTKNLWWSQVLQKGSSSCSTCGTRRIILYLYDSQYEKKTFCRLLFILLSFFSFWPLHCLSFDLRILMTPLISSNFLKLCFLLIFGSR
jgi:hypothetical protein